MSKTSIEWTDRVWNPVTGCTKVSQGCKNCYAERIFGRNLPAMKGQKFTDVTCHSERLDDPLRWRKPSRVFVNSMSDLFHPSVPELFIRKVMAVIAACPEHTFQVLTKRPERMLSFFAQFKNQAQAADGISSPTIDGCIPDDWDFSDEFECVVGNSIAGASGEWGVGWPMKNLWLGVSVENQQAADERIPLLLHTPAAVRFLSCEPLLGPVDLTNLNLYQHVIPALIEWDRTRGENVNPEHYPKHVWLDALTGDNVGGDDIPHLDWVICGGESGPNARPMHPDWARSLRDQCKAAGVSFLFKQWGAFEQGVVEWGNNKKRAGRLLDGVEHNEFPEVSQ